jgi:hypothetical protein
VERIWLPFTPWLLLAGAALSAGDTEGPLLRANDGSRSAPASPNA